MRPGTGTVDCTLFIRLGLGDHACNAQRPTCIVTRAIKEHRACLPSRQSAGLRARPWDREPRCDVKHVCTPFGRAPSHAVCLARPTRGPAGAADAQLTGCNTTGSRLIALVTLVRCVHCRPAGHCRFCGVITTAMAKQAVGYTKWSTNPVL